MPDCKKCRNPELREAWGCDRPSKSGFKYDLGGVITKRCPNALSRMPVVQASWRLYAAYKRGITPQGKGLRVETDFYCNAMALFEALELEAETWVFEKQKQARKKKEKQRERERRLRRG